MIYFFYTIHVMVSLFLILVVLLQQGKGADLSVFGGGGTMTAFGARGAATLLHKMTVFSFVAFIMTTLAIGILQGKAKSRSVIGDDVATTAPADAVADDVTAAAEEAAGAIEGATEDDAEIPGAIDGEADAAPADDAGADDGTSIPDPAAADSSGS